MSEPTIVGAEPRWGWLSRYNFKLSPELKRSLALAALTYILPLLKDFDPADITDPWRWALAVGVGLAHALGAALWAYLGPGHIEVK